jgi:hypothetical protein
MSERWKRYELDLNLVRQRRAAALGLFAGAGTGMDSQASRGTMWGLYNAIVELENFREGGSDEQAATEVLIGDRAAVMQRAFSRALELSRISRSQETVFRSHPRSQWRTRTALAH